jgi:amino acid adenylation domain-containing protein
MKAVVAHEATERRMTRMPIRPSIVSLRSEPTKANTSGFESSVSGGAALACMMYTSGSTGIPKGVMVPHRAVVRLVRDTDYCRFDKGQVFLHLAPLSFDASTFEIWGPLLNGGQLAIMPPGPPALDTIGKAIRRHGVTTLWLTAGLFHRMVEQRPLDLAPLRQLLAGGDVLSPGHAAIARETLARGELINGYGPTENATFSCCHRVDVTDQTRDNVPIGRAIAHTAAYVLDDGLRPVPGGTAGELYLGGGGIAHGYWRRPELTAEAFLPDPFCPSPGARMYRTGDWARARPDGCLEFLGRMDQQVKIAGHRIELGEIETVLRQHLKVRQVAVIALDDGRDGKRLAALLVTETPQGVPSDELREFLAERLPKFMIPATFVNVDELPLSPTGKTDRKALAALAARRMAADAPPRQRSTQATAIEESIIATWERLLGRTPSLDDNFFDLGGDSLLLIEVHGELQKKFGRDLDFIGLFEATTVRLMARLIAGDRHSDAKLEQVQDRARDRQRALARQKSTRVTTG